MKHKLAAVAQGRFQVLLASRSAQCAKMTLRPGASSDEDVSNEHPKSEQWVYVVSGTGRATIIQGKVRRHVKLVPGSVLLIEKRELHQIRNSGSRPLVTINFYVPPAYMPDGEPKLPKGC